MKLNALFTISIQSAVDKYIFQAVYTVGLFITKYMVYLQAHAESPTLTPAPPKKYFNLCKSHDPPWPRNVGNMPIRAHPLQCQCSNLATGKMRTCEHADRQRVKRRPTMTPGYRQTDRQTDRHT